MEALYFRRKTDFQREILGTGNKKNSAIFLKNQMKLNNPYLHFEGFNCYGCAPHNQSGLKMNFELVGETIVSEWMPNEDYQGFHQIMHGGILAVLIDEIAGWAIQIFCKTSGFTTEMQIQYLKPAYIENGPYRLEAVLESKKEKRAFVDVKLWDKEGTLCTTAHVTYHLFSEELARDKFYYPGVKAFLGNQP